MQRATKKQPTRTKRATKPSTLKTSQRSIKMTSKRPPTRRTAQTRKFSTHTGQIDQAPVCLITGASGQVGVEITAELRKRFGVNSVIATDIRQPNSSFPGGPFRYLDVMDTNSLNTLIVENKVTWICHLASILSAVGEKNPALALKLNTRGIENVLEAARMYNLRVFAPSTIAAFGPNTPADNTPDMTIMRPTTMYGVTKVYLELLGDYYKNKYGVDFRSLRYPGVISSSAPPGGGTTDWCVDIYHQALLTGRYTSFLSADSALPMMHAVDCVESTMGLLTADVSKLTQTTYNVTGCSITPRQAAASIQKYLPNFQIDYAPDFRQAIADSWPNSLDDSIARKDWGWKPQYDLDGITVDMLTTLKQQYNIPDSQVKLRM